MKKSRYSYYKDRYAYLFTAAYVICGDEAIAEEIMLDAIDEQGDKLSFDRALAGVKRIAQDRIIPEAEAEFLISGPLSGETALVRRMAMLVYGLGFSLKRAGRICGASTAEAKSAVKRAARFKNIAEMCETELARGECAPDPATFRQLISAYAANSARYAKKRGGIVKGFTVAICMLLIAALIWLSAVMVDYYSKLLMQNRTEVTDVNY